jgi:hypothetical protein
MKRAALLLLVLLTSCDATYTIVVPWCPVSDSAKQAADSIPLFCGPIDTPAVLP